MKARPKISKGHQYFLIAFVAIFMVPAGIGFGCKLFEFFSVVSLPADGRFEDGRFALIPLLNYLLVFGGMLCFLMWAIAHGMFRDVEEPKFTMLENEERLDQGRRD
jgi:nitrogen fixation-related uncharacterized protein